MELMCIKLLGGWNFSLSAKTGALHARVVQWLPALQPRQGVCALVVPLATHVGLLVPDHALPVHQESAQHPPE